MLYSIKLITDNSLLGIYPSILVRNHFSVDIITVVTTPTAWFIRVPSLELVSPQQVTHLPPRVNEIAQVSEYHKYILYIYIHTLYIYYIYIYIYIHITYIHINVYILYNFLP